jgi:hypothetical protein
MYQCTPMEVSKDVEFNRMQTFSKLKSGITLIYPELICCYGDTPSIPKYLSHLTFTSGLIIRLIQKIEVIKNQIYILPLSPNIYHIYIFDFL